MQVDAGVVEGVKELAALTGRSEGEVGNFV